MLNKVHNRLNIIFIIALSASNKYNSLLMKIRATITHKMSSRLAVVTGANKGIGLEIVKGLCENFSGTVYLTSRDEARGKRACEDLEKLGLKPVFYQLDITKEDSIRKFCSHIEKEGRIEILINNAAVLFLKDSKEPKIYQAEQTLLTNLFSLINFTESCLPYMADDGRIVNMSSSSGHLSRIPSEKLRSRLSSKDLSLEELKKLMGDYIESVKLGRDIEDGWGELPYVVSKVGVNAYTFMLHRKLSCKGILVNCVHPGYVMSDMTRGGGSITPTQGAEVPLKMALRPGAGGLYVWHNGDQVPWDGPDPRVYIDGSRI